MTSDRPVMYVNGRFATEDEAALSPLDRGFTLADGLFETMAALGDRVFRMADHLARMQRGAETLHIPLPPADELAAIILESIGRNGYPGSVARLTVSRGVDYGRGLDAPAALDPSVVVRVAPWQGPPDSLPTGRRLAISNIPRNDRSPLSRVKSLSYVEGVAARLEAQRAGADDALLLNTRGLVACGTSSNVFVVNGSILLTPPEGDGVLAGVARRTVLEEARNLGLSAVEQSIEPGYVAGADEVFLTNVVQGPVPVASLDGKAIGDGAPGPVTQALFDAYWERVRRELLA